MKKNEDGKTFLYVFKKATKNGRFFAAKVGHDGDEISSVVKTKDGMAKE